MIGCDHCEQWFHPHCFGINLVSHLNDLKESNLILIYYFRLKYLILKTIPFPATTAPLSSCQRSHLAPRLPSKQWRRVTMSSVNLRLRSKKVLRLWVQKASKRSVIKKQMLRKERKSLPSLPATKIPHISKMKIQRHQNHPRRALRDKNRERTLELAQKDPIQRNLVLMSLSLRRKSLHSLNRKIKILPLRSTAKPLRTTRRRSSSQQKLDLLQLSMCKCSKMT